MQEIKDFVGSTFTKSTSNFTEGIKQLELDNPAEPNALNPRDQVTFKVWKVGFKEYWLKLQEYASDGQTANIHECGWG